MITAAEQIVASGKATGKAEGRMISPSYEGKGASFEGEIKKSVTKLEDDLSNIRNELRRDKVSFVEFCGLFVAIFTFISIEIQIFRFICDFDKIVGFTFIFAGILIGFIFMIEFLLHNGGGMVYWIKFSILLLVLIGLIGIGLRLVEKGERTNWRCESDIDTPSMSNSINIPESLNIQLLPK